jgi:hypothetical protein
MSKEESKRWLFSDSEAVIGNNVITFTKNESVASIISLKHVASVELSFTTVFINIDQGDASSHEPAFFSCKARTKEDARNFFEALKQKMDYGTQTSNVKMESNAETKCPYCKNMISPDSKFCRHCGASLS